MTQRILAWIVVAAAAATLLGCSPSSSSPNGAIVINRGNGPDIKSLDPAFIEGNWEAWVVGDMLLGLTTEGPDGAPVPGAATNWETSADGLTWTFHLRAHLWSDGVPVTSADFVTAWRREVDPKTAAPYAYNLWVVKNAQAISDGKLPPAALGIEAPDDKTFVMHLEHPAAYLPQLMTHQVAYPIPRHAYLKLGDSWSRPENYVANGPYLVQRWIPLDHVTLLKNPRFYDAAHVRIDVVNYYVTNDTEAALKEFRGGELDALNPFPVREIDWMRANLPHDLKIVPYLGLSYIVMNFDRTALRDIRLRHAINLAYDREDITGKVRRIGEPPAYSVVPPGVANFPGTAALDFKPMAKAQRLAEAQALMREMGYGPSRHLHLSYETSTNPDSTRNAAALQRMLSKIYLDIAIVAVEGQVHLINMQQHQFDLAGSAWIADFNDASNFLDLLRTGSGENYGDYSNPAYDAELDAAQRERDPVRRGEMLQQAEEIALKDYAWAPGYFLVTQDLVQPYVKGWIPNIKDFNRTRWLWVEGRPAPS